MRLRFGILALVLAAAVAGCGGSDDKPSSSKTDASTAPTSSAPSSDPVTSAVPCAKFLQSQSKASEVYQKLAGAGANPSSISDAVKLLKAQFEALKEGAPSNVVDALSDLESVYDLYVNVIKDPASAQGADVASLGTRLQKDSETIGAYVTKNCAG